MTAFERITYRFHLDRGIEDIALDFDPVSFDLISHRSDPAPAWCALDNHKCPICPLTAEQSPVCPFAGALAGLVELFDSFYSYDEAVIEVITKNRTMVAKRPLQQGMASLMGLVGATSGCPHLAYFRPMARFHLPFARDDEMLYRVFSMYLLSAYLRDHTCPTDEAVWDELQASSRRVCAVNQCMAARMRAAFDKDVAVNAVIILDSFAQAVPIVIRQNLDELREMFCMTGGGWR